MKNKLHPSRTETLRSVIAVSGLSVMIYYIITVLFAEIKERFDCIIPEPVLITALILLMLAYSIIYVWGFHVLSGRIRQSMREGGYGGVRGDILACLKSEKYLFVTVLLINLFSWAVMEFGLYTVRPLGYLITAFIPLNPLILAHRLGLPYSIISSVIIYVFATVILVLARKITYNRMFPKNKN